MRCTRLLVVAQASLLVACAGGEQTTAPQLSVTATLRASAEGAEPGIFLFHDCVGPAGTPVSFTAQKTNIPDTATPAFSQSTAYRLTDGSAIFIALIRANRHHPPGIDNTDIATTSCLVDTPLLGTVLFIGFLAPPQ